MKNKAKPKPVQNVPQTDWLKRHITKCVDLLFFCLLIFPVIWIFSYQPSPIQDLPNHLANAQILVRYHTVPLFQEYFSIHYSAYPYLLQDFLLASLLYVSNVTLATQLFLSLVILIIPLSSFFFFKNIDSRKSYLAFFSLPLAWNFLLFKGNFNYILGIGIFFINLTFLWKILISPISKKSQWLTLLIGIIILYFTHLVAFALFLFLSAIVFLYQYTHSHAERLRLWKISLALFIVAVPLCAFYIQHFFPNNPQIQFSPFSVRIAQLGLLSTYFAKGDCIFFIPIIICPIVFILVLFFRTGYGKLPIVLCGALFYLYFFVPSEFFSLVRPQERVLYLLLFLLPVCLIGNNIVKYEKTIVIVSCLIVFFLAFSYFSKRAERISRSLAAGRELLQKLPEGKKVLPLWFAIPGYGRLSPWYNLSSYYVADRDGYVPILFSTEYMPVKYITHPLVSNYPSRIDSVLLAGYDYLFIWGPNKPAENLLLAEGYRLLFDYGRMGYKVYSAPGR